MVEWTASEEGFLLENYFFMSAPDIATKLGKRVSAVKGEDKQAQALGLQEGTRLDA